MIHHHPPAIFSAMFTSLGEIKESFCPPPPALVAPPCRAICNPNSAWGASQGRSGRKGFWGVCHPALQEGRVHCRVRGGSFCWHKRRRNCWRGFLVQIHKRETLLRVIIFFHTSFNSQFLLQNWYFEIIKKKKQWQATVKFVWKLFLDVRINATEDNGSFGRFVNHSRLPRGYVFDAKNPPKQNAVPRQVKKLGVHPKLLLVANRDIAAGEEILFDYGERRPGPIADNPWLAPEPNPSARRSSRGKWRWWHNFFFNCALTKYIFGPIKVHAL